MSELIQGETSAWRRIVIQTMALIVDAYREVNSKKLFWLTMILSLLVVAVFAFVGINERGVTVFTWEFPGPWNTAFIPKDQFYKNLFTSIAIPNWLGVIATVLALISVCTMFPDLLTVGSIDVYLAKPVSRLRFFFTKYLLGLMFAAMQVGVFILASFLVIGVRGGSWEWRIFLAIPLVTVFFSYLFCVCVLIGILTRSGIAALLLTILFWGMLFGLNLTDALLTQATAWAEARVENQQRLIDTNNGWISYNRTLPATQQSNSSAFEQQRDVLVAKLPVLQLQLDQYRWWQSLFVRIRGPLPKTDETISLMTRWLVVNEAITEVHREKQRRRDARRVAHGRPARDPDQVGFDDPDVLERTEEQFAARTAIGIIGTSLGFELVVLGLAALVFCRRDF